MLPISYKPISHKPKPTMNALWSKPKAIEASKMPELKYAIGGFEVCEKAWCVLMGINEKRVTLTEFNNYFV